MTDPLQILVQCIVVQLCTSALVREWFCFAAEWLRERR
jgi:hypothetical protein